MIDMTKQYKTRDGLPVEILTTTATDLYYGPVVGLINGFDSPQVWGADGRKYSHGKEDTRDLLEVKPVQEGWINIYGTAKYWNNDAYWYQTRTAADEAATKDRIACIKIQFTKGEGL